MDPRCHEWEVKSSFHFVAPGAGPVLLGCSEYLHRNRFCSAAAAGFFLSRSNDGGEIAVFRWEEKDAVPPHRYGFGLF